MRNSFPTRSLSILNEKYKCWKGVRINYGDDSATGSKDDEDDEDEDDDQASVDISEL